MFAQMMTGMNCTSARITTVEEDLQAVKRRKSELEQKGVPGAGAADQGYKHRLDAVEKIMEQQEIQKTQYMARIANVPKNLDDRSKLDGQAEIRILLANVSGIECSKKMRIVGHH